MKKIISKLASLSTKLFNAILAGIIVIGTILTGIVWGIVAYVEGK